MTKFLKYFLKKRKPGIILAGHGVAKNFKDQKIESVHISISNFKEIISYLEDLDFDFISCRQLIEISKNNFSYKKHWIHLTFDDGYQNNADIIFPYLKSKNIPFTIFVSTNHIKNQERFQTFLIRFYEKYTLKSIAVKYPSEYEVIYSNASTYKHLTSTIKNIIKTKSSNEIESFENDKPMRIDSLLNIAKDPLVSIGAHCHNHIALHANQTDEFGIENITESLNYIKNVWNINQNPTFCYPYGIYTKKWVDICANLQIPLAFSSDSGFISKTTNKMLLPRFWLSTKSRTKIICILSLFGNNILYLFGRKPPKTQHY